MSLLIRDKTMSRDLISERKSLDLDRFDEVWDGVYVMSAMPNDEHQQVVSRVNSIMEDVVGWPGLGEVRPGVNVSDRDDDWKKNYRIPDVAVFLKGSKAINRDTHWVGGPDWLTEILSDGDESGRKMEFYEKVGVQEVLLIDRDPWRIELYQSQNKKLMLVGESTIEKPEVLKSSVLPLAFQLVPGVARPVILVKHTDGSKQWHV